MRIARTLWVGAILIAGLAGMSSSAEKRGPSTPEERDLALKSVRALEVDPLNNNAKDARSALLVWLIQIPDITVEFCSDILGSKFEHKKKYGNEMWIQSSLSSVAFLIEHPDQGSDSLAVAVAGVEGTLRAYESILKIQPKARFTSLDGLLTARDNGTLRDHVAENLKLCKQNVGSKSG